MSILETHTKNTKGALAFPGKVQYAGGMSLRDYFAAHAPITYQDAYEWLECYGGECVGPWPSKSVMETLVRLRFEYADAMICQ